MSVRKSVLFDSNSDVSLDFGSQGPSNFQTNGYNNGFVMNNNNMYNNAGNLGNTAGSGPGLGVGPGSGQESFGYNQRQDNSFDPANTVMDFIGGSDFVGGVAGDFLLRKGMEGIYDRMDRYQSYLDYIRTYFDVENSYVLQKILLLLFPFRHKKWDRKKHSNSPFPNGPGAAFAANFSTFSNANDDKRNINDPDLYLPIMAFISFFLLEGAIMGQYGVFHVETLSRFAFWRTLFWIVEALSLRLGFYFFGLDNVSILDSLAYTGYKFFGIFLIVAFTLFGGSYAFWPIWFYTSISMLYFLVKTLRRTSLHSDDPAMRIRMDPNTKLRNWFLFIVCFLQIPFMFAYSFWSSIKF